MTTLPTFQGCSNNSVGEMCKTGLVQILIHSKCSTNVSRYYLLSSQQTFATSFLSPHYQGESGPLEVSDVVRMPSHPHRSFFWSHSFWPVFKRHEPFGFMGRPGHRLWFPGKLQAASRLVADFPIQGWDQNTSERRCPALPRASAAGFICSAFWERMSVSEPGAEAGVGIF